MREVFVRRLETELDLLELHRQAPDIWPFLLSSEAVSADARWTVLLRHEGEVITESGAESGQGQFLQRLRSVHSPLVGAKLPAGVPELPFFGGWFVYLGYEVAAEIEPNLRLPPALDGLPRAFAARCPAAVLVDHHDQAVWLVAESRGGLERACSDVMQAPVQAPALAPETSLELAVDDPWQFMEGVNRIRKWIVDGDVFQVNLSREWRIQFDREPEPAALYRQLARANPAPFAGLARLPGGTVISSSPERLVEVRGDRVQTRPIAGTRPRGDNDERDLDLSSELLTHPKERAEHIMLIDLERNDLGRVCRPGSVEVNELMALESYAHVHHIVSNVRGRLRESVDPVDVIAALFPGGTITGCPKVRCMEIIAELEGRGRSFYTGSMGYLNFDGSMDLNILIRSMRLSGRSLTFRTGAGIVADSDPRAELAETEAKARGLLRALGMA